MPKLNLLECSIELGPSNIKMPEYGTRYSDGHVETFIAVPDSKIPFSVHLKSNGYIAPGLAFFVYIDGEYQCNRNRVGLKIPGGSVQANEYETEFRVRQKEEKTSFGTFVVRDWSFAKLDRVTANKAPNVNPRFTSNVGTIEVVVLRCRTDQDDMPLPKAPGNHAEPVGKTEKKASSAAKAPSKPPSKAPSKPASSKKAATAQENQGDGMLGGLFGIFDGSCEIMELDGPADERPVGPDGRVKIIAPPNMTWDLKIGTFIPAPRSWPAREIDGHQMDINDFTRPSQLHNFQSAEEAWLDGVDERGGQPGVVINQWGPRRQEDVRGDEYFQPGFNYKRHIHELGESRGKMEAPMVASRRPYDHNPDAQRWDQSGHRQQPQHRTYFTHGQSPTTLLDQAHLQATSHDTQPKPKLIAEELQKASAAIEEYIDENPNGDHIKDAKRDFDTIRRLQYLQQRGGETLMYFPPWLLEVLIDIEVRRQYILSLEKAYRYRDFSKMLEGSADELQVALPDLLLHKNYRVGVREDALALLHMFSERVGTMKNFLDLTEDFPRVSADEIRARLEFLRVEQERVQQSLEMFAQKERPVEYPPQAQWVAHGGGDGAFNNPRSSKHGGWGNEPPNDPHVAGWEKVGSETWKPGQQKDDDREKKDGAHDGWSQKGSEKGAGQRNDDKDRWTFKKPESDKTYEHAFSEKKSKSGWNDAQSQKSQPSRRSHRSNAWGNDSGDQQQSAGQSWDNNNDQAQQSGDRGWESGGAKDADQHGWDGKSEKKSAAASVHSKAKSPIEDAQAKIKPYWKEWNTPLTQDNAAPKQHPKHPREVYNYTPSPLPAVPADKAKDASHAVQIGRGADYSHKCRKPVYMDTMDQPYAVFSFKYRSKEALEKILRIKIDEVDVRRIEEEVEKERLGAMPKYKLVEELMERRGTPEKSAEKDSKGGGDGKAGGETKGWDTGDKKSGWGGQSNKSKSSHRTASKHSKDDNGWNTQSRNGGGGNGWNDDGGEAGNEGGEPVFTGW